MVNFSKGHAVNILLFQMRFQTTVAIITLEAPTEHRSAPRNIIYDPSKSKNK